MRVVELEEKQINGVSVKTTNADEMNPNTAKIGNLHQHFDTIACVDYKAGARVYGVYFDYESDASARFSVLAGADYISSSSEGLEQVTLVKGNYLIFEGHGEMPQAVIDTWLNVWEYFSGKNAEHERAFTTDFELYKSQNEVDVYIAIK